MRSAVRGCSNTRSMESSQRRLMDLKIDWEVAQCLDLYWQMAGSARPNTDDNVPF